MRQEQVNIRKGERYRNGKLMPPPKLKLGTLNSVSQIESIAPICVKQASNIELVPLLFGNKALLEEFQVFDGCSSLRQASMGDP